MSKLKTLALSAAAVLALCAPLSAQDVTGDTVVATVGGTDITIGHMIAMTMTLGEEQRQLPLNVIFEGVLERLIQQEAISQSRPEHSRLTALQLDNQSRSLVASEVVNELAEAVDVSDEAIQTAYDQRFANFNPEREWNASHILVETEEEARAIVEQLRGGADFAAMAKEKSTGPSGPNGGNLNWFGPRRMVPAFEAAVATMEKGEISDPVQTQFGWHVITLNDFRDPGVPALEEMRGELEGEVWQNLLEAEIMKLVDAVEIDRKDVSGVDASVLADPSLVED
ncbi:MAG: peptidylprolyl isomerase [Rhodobacteraceae bacterium]|nr:peptidylprolyl isomerase [Paracoccaceae bacterium]